MCAKFPWGSREQNGFTKLKEGVSQRHQEERGFGIGNGLRSGRDHMMQRYIFESQFSKWMPPDDVTI